MNKNNVAGADAEILGEAERLEVKDKAALVLVELLMDKNILVQIKKYRKLFLRVSSLTSVATNQTYFHTVS